MKIKFSKPTRQSTVCVTLQKPDFFVIE